MSGSRSDKGTCRKHAGKGYKLEAVRENVGFGFSTSTVALFSFRSRHFHGLGVQVAGEFLSTQTFVRPLRTASLLLLPPSQLLSAPATKNYALLLGLPSAIVLHLSVSCSTVPFSASKSPPFPLFTGESLHWVTVTSPLSNTVVLVAKDEGDCCA
jgi:hypothetical protein